MSSPKEKPQGRTSAIGACHWQRRAWQQTCEPPATSPVLSAEHTGITTSPASCGPCHAKQVWHADFRSHVSKRTDQVTNLVVQSKWQGTWKSADDHNVDWCNHTCCAAQQYGWCVLFTARQMPVSLRRFMAARFSSVCGKAQCGDIFCIGHCA